MTREAGTATTARTALPACMWISRPATAGQAAATLWTLWRFGWRKGGEWAIIHLCRRCGALSSNRVAADDNPMKLMSIAMKPLCETAISIGADRGNDAADGDYGQLR